MSKKDTTDPRPAKTQQLLGDALLSLLEEKRWETISVKDILTRSGVARSTFYLHYDNKFDLIMSKVPALSLPLPTTDATDDKNLEEALLPVFQHVYEQRKIIGSILNQPLLAEITETSQRSLAASWVSHLDRQSNDASKVNFIADFLAGALLTTLKEWTRNGCQQTPAAIARSYSTSSLGAINAYLV